MFIHALVCAVVVIDMIEASARGSRGLQCAWACVCVRARYVRVKSVNGRAPPLAARLPLTPPVTTRRFSRSIVFLDNLPPPPPPSPSPSASPPSPSAGDGAEGPLRFPSPFPAAVSSSSSFAAAGDFGFASAPPSLLLSSSFSVFFSSADGKRSQIAIAIAPKKHAIQRRRRRP